jgi:hypothetical protein
MFFNSQPGTFADPPTDCAMSRPLLEVILGIEFLDGI